jgi:hypothetical protein
MKTYVDLVRRRFEDRHANIEANIEKFVDGNLRFTMRIFGDCLDEEAKTRLLGGYSEYRTEEELRAFVREFLPAYTEYAIAELLEKKADGERFEPPYLTQEEYQEMAVREKWPRIAAHLDHVPPLQLRREIARAGMLFRPYMLSDPGFSEGTLEFALYFDLVDRLGTLGPGELRAVAAEIASLVDRAVAAPSVESCEETLREIRTRAARAAGIEADPEALLGPEMERYPREAPPGWKVRELRNTLKTMALKDLRTSALAHIDLLTVEEVREIVSPFIGRFPSFYAIPSRYLQELIIAIAEKVTDRAITFFFERYATGRTAMTPPVSYVVWKLMPDEEKLLRLREDNARMDQAMMARHLARYLLCGNLAEMSDPDRQIALLSDEGYSSSQGSVLRNIGGGGEDAIKRLYDEVTILSLRMMSRPEEGREPFFQAVRERIAAAAGLSIPIHAASREAGGGV